MSRLRTAADAVVLVVWGFALGIPVGAAELPPVGWPFMVQTNGAGAGLVDGDWYTSSAGGGGHHYVTFTVPPGWPTAEPVYVDLFSPGIHSGSTIDAPSGGEDPTQFELYPPGTVVSGPSLPAPGGGLVQTTYVAGLPEGWYRLDALAAPVSGTFVLRSAVLGDDQNGWTVRIGADDDADETTPPPRHLRRPGRGGGHR
ncbi:MAG TPA: hypothetical protein VE669_12490 [Actinomycetota bacterium]|nr:hypothetical protein [Actinomycetota bacterium]